MDLIGSFEGKGNTTEKLFSDKSIYSFARGNVKNLTRQEFRAFIEYSCSVYEESMQKAYQKYKVLFSTIQYTLKSPTKGHPQLWDCQFHSLSLSTNLHSFIQSYFTLGSLTIFFFYYKNPFYYTLTWVRSQYSLLEGYVSTTFDFQGILQVFSLHITREVWTLCPWGILNPDHPPFLGPPKNKMYVDVYLKRLFIEFEAFRENKLSFKTLQERLEAINPHNSSSPYLSLDKPAYVFWNKCAISPMTEESTKIIFNLRQPYLISKQSVVSTLAPIYLELFSLVYYIFNYRLNIPSELIETMSFKCNVVYTRLAEQLVCNTNYGPL